MVRKFSRIRVLAAGLMAVAGLAAGMPAATAEQAPQRILAIGGAVTETLYALGLEDQVVAVDTSSTYPPRALAEKPNVGYIRALSPEGVLSVGPDLIIALDGAGPPDAVKVLKSAAIPFETLPEARDEAAIIANIRRIATLAGVPQRGEELATAVADDFKALAQVRARIAAPRSIVFVLSASGAAPVVGGAGTSAQAMFELAGVSNAMAALSGYKPAVGEAVLAADPYAIVLMKDQNHGVSDAAIKAMPAFAGSQAMAEDRFFRMDGGYLLNFGPRTPQAARDLAALIYPELDLPAMPEHAWTTDQPGVEPPAAARP
ncbi:ABC transporter substrate-binding protein [Ancylobacter dichloromethanicus]|uniref:Hemin ABC transporter substrate-binding protein n=1 Tax=Ancylobacter dichloromethanicus TaxID=518825 RepID=A0A9W6JDH7_9HYPH|nr:ABC transporter substrate-binding protein [Ancylobacter dichloromethanicus]MBS7552088.1 ABC transporter substrate-binding protein [Ancylobacter dichloromethanicus]GLK73820.1 hemin ABC transporter substrate-binding protein [Ancylobacter dichloromethanicus]